MENFACTADLGFPHWLEHSQCTGAGSECLSKASFVLPRAVRSEFAGLGEGKAHPTGNSYELAWATNNYSSSCHWLIVLLPSAVKDWVLWKPLAFLKAWWWGWPGVIIILQLMFQQQYWTFYINCFLYPSKQQLGYPHIIPFGKWINEGSEI